MNPAGAILAFDCAGAACSVVLWRRGQVLASRRREVRHGQAEHLLPLIEEALADAATGYDGLAAIATTVGPGSFTGLRAGLAAARGLALATGLPAVGVSTLDAAVHAVTSDERRGRSVLVAIDSRREEIFVQAFGEDLAALAQPMVLTPGQAAAVAPQGALVVAGDAGASLIAALRQAGREAALATSAGATDPAVVAALAEARLALGNSLPPLSPLYLRPPDVTPQPAAKSRTGR